MTVPPYLMQSLPHTPENAHSYISMLQPIMSPFFSHALVEVHNWANVKGARENECGRNLGSMRTEAEEMVSIYLWVLSA